MAFPSGNWVSVQVYVRQHPNDVLLEAFSEYHTKFAVWSNQVRVNPENVTKIDAAIFPRNKADSIVPVIIPDPGVLPHALHIAYRNQYDR